MEVMDKASEDARVYVGKGMNFTPFEGRTTHRYSRKIISPRSGRRRRPRRRGGSCEHILSDTWPSSFILHYSCIKKSLHTP